MTLLSLCFLDVVGRLRKDYNRARILYTTALNAMEARGPDVQLLLFAFAIFCLVTGVRDDVMTYSISTVYRDDVMPPALRLQIKF